MHPSIKYVLSIRETIISLDIWTDIFSNKNSVTLLLNNLVLNWFFPPYNLLSFNRKKKNTL